jgi:hypothetical protein
MFTARYALSPYIKQIRFVFKGLIKTSEHLHGISMEQNPSEEADISSSIRDIRRSL